MILPVGIFYTLGWLIAVGFSSLVMWIVYIFLEIWWLLAQALVSIINMIGQAIISAINAVGFAIANAFGQPFTPFEHILVSNMQIAQIDPITGEKMILGLKWGSWNLVPASFLKLDSYLPQTFDTDVLIVKIWPALRNFFEWYTAPLATHYTNWLSSGEWWEIGAAAGIPIALIIIAVVASVLYMKRRMY